MSQKNVTPADLERFFDVQGDDLCAKWKAAQEEAKTVRAVVDEYIEPIFHTFGFKNQRTGEPIKHSNFLYLTGNVQDELCEQYYAACDVAHREHGHELQPGYCPALIAENAAIQAESALIDAVGKLMGFENVYGENRKKLLGILNEMHTARQRKTRRLRKLLTA